MTFDIALTGPRIVDPALNVRSVAALHPDLAPKSMTACYGNHLDWLWDRWEGVRQAAEDAQPRPIHHHLASIGIPIITENIAGLHRAAGSEYVIDANGTAREVMCLRCHTTTRSGRTCVSCGSQRTRLNINMPDESLRHRRLIRRVLRKATRVYLIGLEPDSLLLPMVCHAGVPAVTLIDPEPWGDFDEHIPVTPDEWAAGHGA